jgi:hypothetical protein
MGIRCHETQPICGGFGEVEIVESEPVKKPLTAETAETAEKKTLRILDVLGVRKSRS